MVLQDQSRETSVMDAITGVTQDAHRVKVTP